MTEQQISQTPPNSEHVDLEKQKRGRRMFLLMFAIFFGPFIVAALAKYNGWFAIKDTVNYGTIISPPVQLSDAALMTQNNKSEKMPIQLRDKWSLLVALPAGCADECVKSLREIEAIHLLLNRDIQRVQLLLADGMNVVPGIYTEEMIANNDWQLVSNEIAKSVPQDAHGLSGTYLIDPRGFLVMQYPQILEPKKLQKDLKRLLKYSRIG